ncbi:carbohydrate ABC transporter permease [Isoptericola sp. b441]|uniref:Carbohydrate ABC transporter permease n=1 Tax=Actinotalea lenta TaxID=3064654 RepID=A0ABT9DAM2_9CELL|nr:MULTISPECIES: carbohydrate ABC transporter permease [unclassified Isoptericola]MDO8105987.1 carbohydrate ABC transporter permease [Isoptericola sp. b441]MDO8122294.1 carbohydrate ABC transporter permease [Isoptericola sp. b490]
MPDVATRPAPATTSGSSAPARPRPRITVGRVALHLVVVAGALVMLFPFAWAVVTSISPGSGLTATPSLIPDQPSLSAYVELFTRLPFARVTLNSLGLAVAATLLQMTTGAMAAYAFSRLDFRGRDALFAVYLATMMVPLQVLIVPLFAEMKTFGLIDSYLGALLPTVSTAFAVFLLRQAVNQVPRELDEAATLDGAGHWRIFTRIVLPNIRPALATLAVFAFMQSWNAFLWPLIILRSPQRQTFPVALQALQGQYTTQWDVVMAGSVVSILPMLALYVLAQRYVVQGVASSGLK